MTEILVATVVIVFSAASAYVLMASATRLTGHRSNRQEAYAFGVQTLELLKNYVTQSSTDSQYHISGDDPGPNCGGGSPGRYALAPLNSGSQGHCHTLPAGPFRDARGGNRTYRVWDVDLNADGQADLKRVTVTVNWNEPAQ